MNFIVILISFLMVSISGIFISLVFVICSVLLCGLRCERAGSHAHGW